MRTWAGWPSFTPGMDASSTSISASTRLMSDTVRSTVPGWFCSPGTAVSPSSMCLAVTMPAMGEVTWVFSRTSAAPARSARAWSTCWRALRTAASSMSRLALACSKSLTEMICALKLSWALR